MRKFIAACCCVIVGLEVLICIPVALVVAYAYGAASTPVVMTAPADASAVASTVGYCTPAGSSYSTTPSSPFTTAAVTPYCDPAGSGGSATAWSPAPASAAPLAYAPSALPAATFNPYVSAPPSSARCPSPAVIPRVDLPASPPPLPITAAAVAPPSSVSMARQIAVDSASLAGESTGASGQVSDDAEQSPYATPAEDREPSQKVAAAEIELSQENLQRLVRDWHQLWSAASALPHVAARLYCGAGCEAGAAAAADPVLAAKAGQDAAIESMEHTAQQLYAEAGRCEERYDFDSADQLRKLARELRIKSVEIQERRLEAESRRRAQEDYLQSPTP